MTLYNLALKNIQAQFRNYLVYFFSMAFCVMVFYSFIAISYDQTLVEKASADLRIDTAMKSASLVIVLFILVFMNTANNYFVKRRKREIGLYNLLGMRKSQIGWLFFLENIFLGLTSLLVGTLLGILLSKFFSMILIKAMALKLESRFVISFSAIFLTALIFMVILLLVSFKSGSTVYRFKLVDLFKSASQGDRVTKVGPLTIILGLSGIGMIGFGYYMAANFMLFFKKVYDLTDGSRGSLIYLLLAILILCITGSFLFFRFGLVLLIALSQKFKGYYYKNLNMVTTGNLRFHLRQNTGTLGMIAILCGTAIAAIGGAVAVYSYSMDEVDASVPASFIVAGEEDADFLAVLQEAGAKVLNTQTVHYKIANVAGEVLYFEEKTSQTFSQEINVMAFSEYQALTKIYKQFPALSLEKDEVVFLGYFFGMQGGFELPNKQVHLGDFKETFTIKELSNNAPSGAGVDFGYAKLVVADEVYQKLTVPESYALTLINVKNSDHDATVYQYIQEHYPERSAGQTEKTWLSGQTMMLGRNNYVARYPMILAHQKVYGVLIYIAMFIGIVLLVATGSIIMLKQLGEAEDEKNRYQVLRKLGVQKAKIRKSVYKQNLFVFLSPMLLALSHAWFANTVLASFLEIKNFTLSFIACGVLLVIYLLFYLWTARAYNQTVNA